jgi:hypothetical protein
MRESSFRTRRSLAALAAACLLCLTAACSSPDAETRAREAAEAIQASIKDYDTAALNQKVDKPVVVEVQTQLTQLHEYMGEINGEIDAVLVNSIQAFQRAQNDKIPWWQFWARHPNDGLITDRLRSQLAAATGARATDVAETHGG